MTPICTKVAWVRAIQNSYNYGGLLLGLVAVATESYNGKMVKLHFYALPQKMASVLCYTV